MRHRYSLALFCFLGTIFLQPLIAKAAEVGSTLAVIPSTLEAPPASSEVFQPSIVQIIESPSSPAQPIEGSSAPPPEESTNLVIESPSVESPANSTNLVIESPSVSPFLPKTVAEAEGYTLERKSREKQNIDQYQASLLAEANSQKPVPEETLSPDLVPVAVESPAVVTENNVDILVLESPGRAVSPISEAVEASAADQVKTSTDISLKKIELAELTFQCDKRKGVPSTIAKVKDSGEILLILWSSDFFKSAGYDAQTRCNQVSARFAAYSKDSSPAYLVTGKMNGQSVVCFTSKENGGCGGGTSPSNGLLFTLKPNDNSQQVLQDLVSLLQSKAESEQVPIEQ